MQATHFDRFTIALATRRSRRRVMLTGIGALATSVLSGSLRPTRAQDATPTVQPNTPTTVYVQLADNGTWVPKPDEPGTYLLTLFDPGDQTLACTLAPDRFVATMPTEELLNTLGFTPENPPNAAVEVVTSDGGRDVIVVELTDPVYAVGSGEDTTTVLIYEARVLSAYRGTALQEWTPDVDDDQLPAVFEEVSLFIDNGCWSFTGCYLLNDDGSYLAKIGSIPSTPNLARCPGVVPGTCVPCSGNSIETLHARCNAHYDDCEGRCIAD
jgi:hypothetical protein